MKDDVSILPGLLTVFYQRVAAAARSKRIRLAGDSPAREERVTVHRPVEAARAPRWSRRPTS